MNHRIHIKIWNDKKRAFDLHALIGNLDLLVEIERALHTVYGKGVKYEIEYEGRGKFTSVEEFFEKGGLK